MRRLAVAALGACAIAFLVLGLRGRQRSSAPASPAAPPAVAWPRRLVVEGAAVSAWLGQPNLGARRIAGRVTFEGQPVGGATVRLTTGAMNVGDWTLAALPSRPDGRFDFGPVPAANYHVRAEAPGHVAADAEVDLRAPAPKPVPDGLELELGPCLMRVHGTVRDAAGGLVAGARVRAARSGFIAVANAVADEQGRYELCALPGAVHVEAVADGYGAAVVHATGRAQVKVDLALRPEVVIAGSVVDEDGAPVASALVALETDGHLPGAIGETDGDGRFRIGGLAAMSYVVSARVEDRAAEKPIAAMAPGTTIEVALRLGKRATLRGRVVVAGQPAGGATVEASVPTDERYVRVRGLGSAVSQPDGRFLIAGLPRRLVRLRVEGHRLLTPKDLDLAGDREVDLVCEKLPTVSGRVLRDDKPAAHTTVILQTENEPRDQRAQTQADGLFKIEGVTPGAHTIGADDGERLSGQQPLEVGGRDVDGVTLKLDLDASIAGVVVDQDGKPVAGANVGFMLDAKRDRGEAVTGADGTFLITSLAGGGDYRPSITTEEGRWLRPPSAPEWPTVHVPDGYSHVTGVRLTVAAGTLTITGRVVRVGAPVPDLEIGADGEKTGVTARAQSGPSGAFELTGLVAGNYQVRVGGPPIRIVRGVEAGARDVTIDLPAVGAIEGTLDGFHGWPQVSARASASDAEFHFPLQASVADGSFAFAQVPVGGYSVTASGGSGESASAEVTVVADAVARVTLRPEPRAHVDGVALSWPSRKPVAGVACTWVVEGVGSHGGASEQTDAAGRFSLEIPASRQVRVSCGNSWKAATVKDARVELAAGASTTVEVLLYTMKPGHQPLFRHNLQIDGSERFVVVSGAAEAAGLRVGDVLVAIDGISLADIDTPFAIAFLLGDREPGVPAALTIERDGVEQTIQLPVPAERP